ncbi:hypothetical protein BC938DRAFT_476021 [Jimgerdemannia flammicorona]|uniref:Uncharacterized protein n=1 Tax=Jimgerdemannia flammicorona TaxID=994334 RepID=A0A433QR18_9FUNG|nr:hypothetical protein BC938DRAFT_476021 [Jimgerdemannia flammicorona]
MIRRIPPSRPLMFRLRHREPVRPPRGWRWTGEVRRKLTGECLIPPVSVRRARNGKGGRQTFGARGALEEPGGVSGIRRAARHESPQLSASSTPLVLSTHKRTSMWYERYWRLAQGSSWRIVTRRSRRGIGGAWCTTMAEPLIRTSPAEDFTNGFFVACFVRKRARIVGEKEEEEERKRKAKLHAGEEEEEERGSDDKMVEKVGGDAKRKGKKKKNKKNKRKKVGGKEGVEDGRGGWKWGDVEAIVVSRSVEGQCCGGEMEGEKFIISIT